MFVASLTIGIYSYLIFLLGILGLLYKNIIISLSLLYFFAAFTFLFKLKIININFTKIKLSRFSKFFLSIILLQALVNLIGALGPELAFDALWYHLTIPKIFLENHKIFHIPGNLLYYSDLPKSIDLMYLSALSFSNEILAKIIHFSFGVLSIFALYKLSRRFLNKEFSLLSCLIFYSNLVVGWQSITAYVDLGRTFFEIISLFAFLNWIEYKKTKWLVFSGITLGFAISSKLIALTSLIIFLSLFMYKKFQSREKSTKLLINFSIFVFFALLISLPWFMLSYVNTGNIFYPYFTNIPVDSGKTFILPNFSVLFSDLFTLFLRLNDPITPIYLITIPLIIVNFKKYSASIKYVVYYLLLGLIIWYFVLEDRGGRFVLPYLPAFSILAAVSISLIKNNLFKYYLILLIIIVSLSSIGYRFLANYKYIPVILNIESKDNFLSNNLNFSFGDFYDTDSYFKNNIKKKDKVLLYGFHNLYYVNFPYIDSSQVRKGDRFNYIAVKNSVLPARFLDWKEIYYNKQTKVKLYSKGKKLWVY